MGSGDKKIKGASPLWGGNAPGVNKCGLASGHGYEGTTFFAIFEMPTCNPKPMSYENLD